MGKTIDPEKRKTLIRGLRLSKKMNAELEREAKRRGIDFSKLTRNILEEFLRPGTVKL